MAGRSRQLSTSDVFTLGNNVKDGGPAPGCQHETRWQVDDSTGRIVPAECLECADIAPAPAEPEPENARKRWFRYGRGAA